MKNYLTNLFNLSIFRCVQRLAIVCVLLSYAAAAAGNNSGYMYVKPAPEPYGHGKVYVSRSESTENTSWDFYPNSQRDYDVSSETGTSSNSHTWYLYTRPETDYYHAGWVKVNGSHSNGGAPTYNSTEFSVENIILNSARVSPNSYPATAALTSSKPGDYYYAVFKHKPVVKITTTATLSTSSMIDDVPMGYVLVSESATAADDDINRITHDYISTERTVDNNAECQTC